VINYVNCIESYKRGVFSAEFSLVISSKYTKPRTTGYAPMESWKISEYTPVSDFAYLLAVRGINGIDSVIGRQREEYLEITTVVNEADRALRREIHDAEWALLAQRPDQRIAFCILRRRGFGIEELVPISKERIVIDMRGMYAYHRSTSQKSGSQQEVCGSDY
jgi:hypothetical protein